VSLVRLRPVWMTNHPPSALWHCWLGHQTCKNCRLYNLFCVGADVKPCSINAAITCGKVSLWLWKSLQNLGNFFLLLCGWLPCFRTFLLDIHSVWSLTLWRPLLPYGYSYNECQTVKLLFVIFDIWALWHSLDQNAQMSKITNDSLTRSVTVCFVAIPIWQQWVERV